MIVVADTGPINYLVLIGAVEVLGRLYGRVVIPRSVVAELQNPLAPAAVLTWISTPPKWLDAQPDPPLDSTLDFLDPGERAALTLAQVLCADQLLIDERSGRAEAE